MFFPSKLILTKLRYISIHINICLCQAGKRLLFTLKNKSGKSKAKKIKLKHVMLGSSVMTKYAEPWHASEISECLFSFSVYHMVTMSNLYSKYNFKSAINM